MNNGTKISELPALETLADSDILAGVDTSENVTSKVALSTLKDYISDGIELTDYVKNTDYATSTTGGVLKVGSNAFSLNNDGKPQADIRTYENYSSAGNNIFIGKGTLENVLNTKIGDIDSVLDAINGEVI